jgi:hypothetical protein
MLQNYAESLKPVLLKKIDKAERDLHQLKMDYCRFVFGISHRTRVEAHGKIFIVKAVDIDSMQREENGEWSQPTISGWVLNAEGSEENNCLHVLTPGWKLA